MKTVNIFIIGIFLSLCVSQCSNNSPQKGTAASTPQAEDNLVVKGLSLGMDFGNAREQVLKLFEESGFVSDISIEVNADNTEVCVKQNLAEMTPICVQIWKDLNNRLNKIEMSTYAVNTFFNASKIEAEEFSKEFAKNYHLSVMNAEKDKTVGFTYWKYESKKGWSVSINDAKFLTIKYIMPKNRPRFD